jgi:hypothetical protein
VTRILRWSSLSLVLFVVGCRSEKGTEKLSTDLEADPKALSFTACPSKDENGGVVSDVFPDEKVLKLSNRGRTSGKLELSLTGTDASDFALVADKTPKEIGATSDVQIPVRFLPTRTGPHQASLVIDDGDSATQPLTVDLGGTGRKMPFSQPTLKVSVQAKDDPATFNACVAGLSCMPVFNDTFFGQSSTLKIKLANEGCPALKITGAELKKYSDTDENLAFFLDAPAVIPTASAPLVLTSSGGNDETTLLVRFTPEEDLSGNTQRYAILSLKTNDPTNPEFLFTLYGNGVKPSLSVAPTSCVFSDPTQNCGNTPRVANEARFAVQNIGSANLTVESVSFENGGQGRFTVTQNVQGATLTPLQSSALVVRHTDLPLFVMDRLIVNAGPAGSIVLTVSGGKPPMMETEPALRLDFGNPTATETTLPVTVRANATAGALVLRRVYLDTSNEFSLVNAPAANTTLNPGEVSNFQVKFVKPVRGGQQIGVLHIESNDPRYGAPNHKMLTLYSESPPDLEPTSVLTGCLAKDLATKPQCTGGATTAMTVNLSTLTIPKQVTVSGIDSFDTTPTGNKPVAQYEFRLTRKPTTTSTVVKLENDGVKQSSPTAVLTLDPIATGEYKVLLRTYDDQGQASPTWGELKIFAQ